MHFGPGDSPAACGRHQSPVMYGDYLDGSGEERNDCGENEGGVIEQYADEQELAALWALSMLDSQFIIHFPGQ